MRASLGCKCGYISAGRRLRAGALASDRSNGDLYCGVLAVQYEHKSHQQRKDCACRNRAGRAERGWFLQFDLICPSEIGLSNYRKLASLGLATVYVMERHVAMVWYAAQPAITKRH